MDPLDQEDTTFMTSTGPYLKCLEDPETQDVLKDIHEGDCGNHTGGRFMISAKIICDNGSQFIGKMTTDFCATWGIKMITSTPLHPLANGQAESSNKRIINNLNNKLGIKEIKWAEEVPFVLLAYRTTSNNATSQTPFSLLFEAEAIINGDPTARSYLQNPETKN
ncbi:uncharacterized protein LOC143630356 [Bidens hawaiensis]|uniref:uncharacterized protein LOC143630356 n=1 Tax=Bidens hawaiensis TaxID=980011 RepID=UPI004049393D